MADLIGTAFDATTTSMRNFRVVVYVAAVTASACGDSPTQPSSSSRVEAMIQDAPAGGPGVSGNLVGDVSVSIWDGSRWQDLGSPHGITVPLQLAGRTTTVHGEQSVPPGEYSRVRFVLQRVSARLARGSTVGSTTLAADSALALGGSDQRAELTVSINSSSLESGASRRLVIVLDMRSYQWLTTSALRAGVVEDATLTSAVTANARLESR